ncbi:MAG: Gfo/Idh/MocA family oxidoreductase [Bacteroidales bacterium]|nr:Gfo/Idh/MocA family oxidoreductase [Bacteroidales bacterium]
MKPLKNIRWGFIGCGEVTEKKSGPAFSMIEGSEAVAVMSRDRQKAKSYAERHGIRHYYNDPVELINDPDVNAVYIATPPSSHATFAMMALRAGKPAYVEKPLAASYEDCLRINKVSEQTGIPCFVAYYRRYLPYFQKVKELVDTGQIGKILSVQIRFAVPPRELDYNSHDLPWRLQPDIAGAGGYFNDLAPHQLDMIQYIFGNIVEAEGYSMNMLGLYKVADTINGCFKFHSGLTGSGSWSFVAHDSARTDRIEIFGDKGMICFSIFDYTPLALHTESGRHEIIIENPKYVQLPLIQAVVEDLRGGAKCSCTSISATAANWVMDKIIRG